MSKNNITRKIARVEACKFTTDDVRRLNNRPEMCGYTCLEWLDGFTRIKMTAPKLKHKENISPKIKRIETTHKPVKAIHNRICGIGLILLGVASIALQNGIETTDGTAAVMLFVMGLAAIFSE